MNFKRVSILSLIFLLVVSCQEKKDKIEIYLLNKRIVSSEGIPFPEVDGYDSISDEAKKRFQYSSYNTIDSSLIYAGKFEVEISDINEKPLVENNEILSFNLKNNTIKISKTGVEKITNLENDAVNSIQFVICVNNKPIMTGYFNSFFSSYIPTSNFISYLPKYKFSKYKIKEEEFELRKNNNFRRVKVEKIDLVKDYPELIQAFKNTNRLIEE